MPSHDLQDQVCNDPAENPKFTPKSGNAPGRTFREGTLALPYDAFVTFAFWFFNVITKTAGLLAIP